MKLKLLIISSLFILLFTNCKYKHLDKCEDEGYLEVKFDWTNVTDIPTGMTTLFYSIEGNLLYQFNIPSTGEKIKIPNGKYSVVCYNNDSEYVQWIGKDKLSTLHAITREGSLEEDHSRTKAVKADELFIMPDDIYGCVKFEVIVDVYGDIKDIILLKPLELVDKYTYYFYGVENSEYITQIKASLSGLAGELYMVGDNSNANTVTMAFNANVDESNGKVITGTMYNFGFHKNTKNILKIYIWSRGGNLIGEYDVTTQVEGAPNPYDVIIIIDSPIIIPPPISEDDDSLNPSVDDWNKINEEIIL